MEENQDFVSIERPKYGKFVYVRGENSCWRIDDSLGNEFDGEIGKVVGVELDKTLDDWVYTFDNGYKCDESILIEKETYRIL